jgi:pimeloyl-ACP methyl ester carboxylesterase
MRQLTMILAGFLLAAPAGAADLPRGTVLRRQLRSDSKQEYFLYVPPSAAVNARVFVTVHGISRNAEEHIRRFKQFANEYGVVVVSPLFSEDRYPDYQTLGVTGRGQRADIALQKIIAEIGTLRGTDIRQIYLFGYSGGGQFVHRYAMAYPRQVAAVAIGAAGWYTFPDPAVKFPRGLKLKSPDAAIQFTPEEFLQIPMAVFVGERDGRSAGILRCGRRVDTQQGLTRIERGYRWTEAMNSAAATRNLSTPHLFRVIPYAAHSFKTSMKRGDMGRQVSEFLFGSSLHAPQAVNSAVVR